MHSPLSPQFLHHTNGSVSEKIWKQGSESALGCQRTHPCLEHSAGHDLSGGASSARATAPQSSSASKRSIGCADRMANAKPMRNHHASEFQDRTALRVQGCRVAVLQLSMQASSTSLIICHRIFTRLEHFGGPQQSAFRHPQAQTVR
jgi:hypothetical protein